MSDPEMNYTRLRFEAAGPVATLTLARPEVLNALDLTLLDEIGAVLDRVTEDRAIRALLVTGQGRAFCAGADIPGFVQAADGQASDVLERWVNPLIARIRQLRVPVVSAVNGAAAGGGFGLALAADIVIAARSAYFLFPFTRLGLVPDSGLTWLVPRLIGAARARAVALLGERIPADAAAEWGLIWQAVEDAALPGRALEIAGRLAAGPTEALRLAREGFAEADGLSLAETLDLEARNQRLASARADAREGLAAMIGRRAPRFTGE